MSRRALPTRDPARRGAAERPATTQRSATTVGMLLALQLALLASTACARTDGPRPLVAGEDACDYCRMAVSDTRYGGEVRTSRGRIVTFDAVECLASYIAAATDPAQIAGVWVADFAGGGMIPAEQARYVSGGSLHSPMGRQLTSFAPSLSADTLVARYGGTVLTWDDVLALAPVPAHAPPS